MVGYQPRSAIQNPRRNEHRRSHTGRCCGKRPIGPERADRSLRRLEPASLPLKVSHQEHPDPASGDPPPPLSGSFMRSISGRSRDSRDGGEDPPTGPRLMTDVANAGDGENASPYRGEQRCQNLLLFQRCSRICGWTRQHQMEYAGIEYAELPIIPLLYTVFSRMPLSGLSGLSGCSNRNGGRPESVSTRGGQPSCASGPG